MQSIIIFGANSQDGYYLADLYKKKGYDVFGVSRTGDWLRGNIESYEFVEKIIKNHKPIIIFHLAAKSTTFHEAIFENHKIVGTGTLNILEAVYRFNQTCKVFITGSGLQFANKGEPIHETDSFEANSAYSVERIYSVYLARYFRSLGLRVYVGYLFHHESPLRKTTHISQKIIQAVKRISAGSDEKIELGDISVEKEWAFAGDVTEGIAILVGQDQVYEAVIGTGKTHTIEDWLKICFALIGKDWANYVVIRDGFSAEYKRLFSNPSTMHSLGWFPKIEFAELAELMLRA
jgi:GDPmannose 4,6-dehydratase